MWIQEGGKSADDGNNDDGGDDNKAHIYNYDRVVIVTLKKKVIYISSPIFFST